MDGHSLVLLLCATLQLITPDLAPSSLPLRFFSSPYGIPPPLTFKLAPCLSKFPVLPCRAAATTIYSFLTNGIITYRSFARSCCVRPASICKEFWQDMGSLQGFTRHPALRLLLQLTTNRTLVQYFLEKAREEVGDHQSFEPYLSRKRVRLERHTLVYQGLFPPTNYMRTNQGTPLLVRKLLRIFHRQSLSTNSFHFSASFAPASYPRMWVSAAWLLLVIL